MCDLLVHGPDDVVEHLVRKVSKPQNPQTNKLSAPFNCTRRLFLGVMSSVPVQAVRKLLHS